jgi:Ca2+-binding RTX toxin-like protein
MLGGSGNDTVSGIEGVGGTPFDDVIKGGGNHNSWSGGVGDDTLRVATATTSCTAVTDTTLIGEDGLDTCESGEVTDSCEFLRLRTTQPT